MIKITNIQGAMMIGALLILLSGDAFAVTYATQSALNTEVTNRNTAISTERIRATGAEGTLRAADTAETARATKAEGTLRAADTAETARAKVAEGALKAADTAETARATKAEGTLTTAIATETARAKAAEPSVLIPGDSYQGGIVFWVDQTGQHGLIAAKADQSSGIQWYNGTYFATNATADGIYAGAKNTEVIISTQTNVGLACSDPGPNPIYPYYCTLDSSTVPASTAPYAALVAANYSIQDDGTSLCTGAATETCYGDWYLPSKFELNLLYAQKSVVGGFAGGAYWSSTESLSNYAWFQDFNVGVQVNVDKVNAYYVRAIRAF